MKDLQAEVREQKSQLEKIMKYIPLYHGYKEKELRRESDRLLRNHIFEILSDAKKNLKKSQNEFLENDQIGTAKNLDKVISYFDTVSQKINHAEAGYSGFWDAIKIKENDLEKLYQIDEKIADIAEKAKNQTPNLSKNKSKTLDDLQHSVETIEIEIENRKRFLKGFGELNV